jgi:hypothetical protein
MVRRRETDDGVGCAGLERSFQSDFGNSLAGLFGQ